MPIIRRRLYAKISSFCSCILRFKIEYKKTLQPIPGCIFNRSTDENISYASSIRTSFLEARSRLHRLLHGESRLRFDTAENEPAKSLQNLPILLTLTPLFGFFLIFDTGESGGRGPGPRRYTGVRLDQATALDP